MATTTTVTEVQEQSLGLIKESQDAALNAVRAWSEAVARITPDSSALPFGRPAEAAERAYDIAGKLLDYQREFVLGLLNAVTPAEQAAERAAKGPKRS